MSRKKKPRPDGDSEVPMSAMIDVVFLLLVFFIVTSKEVVDECHVAVNMPSPSTAPPDPNAIPPTVVELALVSKAGTDQVIYLFKGQEMLLSGVRSKLNQIALMGDGSETITVNIKTALDVKNRHFISLLSECKKAGLNNLNIYSLKKQIGRK